MEKYSGNKIVRKKREKSYKITCLSEIIRLYTGMDKKGLAVVYESNRRQRKAAAVKNHRGNGHQADDGL